MTGDAGRLEFGTQTLNGFGEGGEAKFFDIGEEEIGELVGGGGRGSFFDELG